jgi:hypothetical protein
VISSYNGANCNCGQGGDFVASGFTPTDNFDFIGAAAFVENQSGNPEPFSMALYSSTSAGGPGASLWTTRTLTAPGPSGAAALVSASYSGSPILLQSGQEYFLVLDLSARDFPIWLASGSSFTPTFFSPDGSLWTRSPRTDDLQFEVSGASVAVVPEPAPWAMLLLGFAGLGFAASRPNKRFAFRRNEPTSVR